MLENVHRVRALEETVDGRLEDVVHATIEPPYLTHALAGVVDENGIEVDRRNFGYLLTDDSGGETIGTPDLESTGATTQHLCNELVTCKREEDVTRVVTPGLIDCETQAFHTL